MKNPSLPKSDRGMLNEAIRGAPHQNGANLAVAPARSRVLREPVLERLSEHPLLVSVIHSGRCHDRPKQFGPLAGANVPASRRAPGRVPSTARHTSGMTSSCLLARRPSSTKRLNTSSSGSLCYGAPASTRPSHRLASGSPSSPSPQAKPSTPPTGPTDRALEHHTRLLHLGRPHRPRRRPRYTTEPLTNE